MPSILGLKFRDEGQVYYFDSGPFVVSEGDCVLVKTDEGMGLGRVVAVREQPPQNLKVDEIKTIYRIATDEDLAAQEANREQAREAFRFCKQCIENRGLDMKLVDVEVYFDRSKIIFYFTAPCRIDFRDLVKDLVRNYRTRIELRQIGVRHETQMIGAVGNCGQVCCCRRFLRKFAPVTIKMAKEQNLFLNPAKISGICGRLLCCLNFEQVNYEDFHEKCPKIGKKFFTGLGQVKVLRANMFRQSLCLLTETGEEKEVSLDEWLQILQDSPEDEAQARPADQVGGSDKPSSENARLPEREKADAGQSQPGEKQARSKPRGKKKPGMKKAAGPKDKPKPRRRKKKKKTKPKAKPGKNKES